MMDHESPTLAWSPRLDDAVRLAGRVHRDCNRKGTRIAYIAHLFDVASIAIKHGADEDETAGALLHDTLEDGDDPERLRAEIRELFGRKVLEIVEACTDTVVKPKPEWRPRKEAYIEAIAHKSPSAKLVSASDKVANLGDMIEDYRRYGDALWKRFNAGRDDILWYYRSCAREFAKPMETPELQPLLQLLRSRTDEFDTISRPR
jgi:(p)ppGpp synthase/HD superfamily hydrolase